jgi:multidrug resistance protein, MATE family
MAAKKKILRESQEKWQHEAKFLARSSWPLILTGLLQYSLPMAAVLTVGQLGKFELGAASLGTATANITGYAVFQGFATSLDTLCAQAYGAGRKKLVGLHVQRMVCLLWVVTIPIGMIWLNSERLLSAIVPERETVKLTSQYLSILLLGAPGWVIFESGKRFLQAQGIFRANLYILLVLAPLNVVLNWFFVWHVGLGFIGAPLAVAVTDTLLPLGLLVYVRFVGGGECWGGISSEVLSNWGPMVRLGISGFLMVEAEWMAFELLTLSASWLGPNDLAAQGILITLASLSSQIPNPLGIAASTRVANLVGARLPADAKLAAKVALGGALLVGGVNATIMFSLRNFIPWLFTSADEVAHIASAVLPVTAAFQLLDALTAVSGGLVRGMGRQKVGGYAALPCYYLVRTAPFRLYSLLLNRTDRFAGILRRGVCTAPGSPWPLVGPSTGFRTVSAKSDKG